MKYFFYVLVLSIAFTTTSFTDNEEKKNQLRRQGIETLDYQKFIEYLNNIIERADDYYYRGDIDSAIIEMGRFIYYSPDFFGGYYRRGFYKDNAGMVEEAIADYTKAISLNPSYTYAYLGRADQYKKQGKTDLSNADFLQILELDTVPSAQPLRAYAYVALGEKEKGMEFLDSCLSMFPDCSGLRYDATCLASRCGDYKKALEYLEEAFRMGYNEFVHLDMDDDMDKLRNKKKYKRLIDKYKRMVSEDK